MRLVLKRIVFKRIVFKFFVLKLLVLKLLVLRLLVLRLLVLSFCLLGIGRCSFHYLLHSVLIINFCVIHLLIFLLSTVERLFRLVNLCQNRLFRQFSGSNRAHVRKRHRNYQHHRQHPVFLFLSFHFFEPPINVMIRQPKTESSTLAPLRGIVTLYLGQKIPPTFFIIPYRKPGPQPSKKSKPLFLERKKGTLTSKPESLSFLYIIPGTSMGTYRIMKNTKTSPRRYGTTALAIRSMGSPVIPEATNKLMATGGVIIPMAIPTTNTIPK